MNKSLLLLAAAGVLTCQAVASSIEGGVTSRCFGYLAEGTISDVKSGPNHASCEVNGMYEWEGLTLPGTATATGSAGYSVGGSELQASASGSSAYFPRSPFGATTETNIVVDLITEGPERVGTVRYSLSISGYASQLGGDFGVGFSHGGSCGGANLGSCNVNEFGSFEFTLGKPFQFSIGAHAQRSEYNASLSLYFSELNPEDGPVNVSLYDPAAVATPEPASALLVALGGVGLLCRRRFTRG